MPLAFGNGLLRRLFGPTDEGWHRGPVFRADADIVYPVKWNVRESIFFNVSTYDHGDDTDSR